MQCLYGREWSGVRVVDVLWPRSRSAHLRPSVPLVAATQLQAANKAGEEREERGPDWQRDTVGLQGLLRMVVITAVVLREQIADRVHQLD